MIDDIVYKASQLIYKGLNPKSSPQRDKEYKELLYLCLSSHEFMDMVHSIAEGLSLTVVDISDRGVILSPMNADSRFVMTLGEYRKELEGDEADAQKALVALLQVAIASTFFPTAEQLDDDDSPIGRSATIKEIYEVLIGICKKLVTTEDKEIIHPGFVKGAELIMNMPESIPTQVRPTLKSVRGAITIVANQLDEQGLLKFEQNREGGCYFVTYRYQQLLKRRSVGRLFDICHQLYEEDKKQG